VNKIYHESYEKSAVLQVKEKPLPDFPHHTLLFAGIWKYLLSKSYKTKYSRLFWSLSEFIYRKPDLPKIRFNISGPRALNGYIFFL